MLCHVAPNRRDKNVLKCQGHAQANIPLCWTWTKPQLFMWCV